MARSMKVAVIGAGPGGLTSARELQKEGHEVVVYEKANQIGGIWAYDSHVEEDDPLGLNPNRKIVHGSVYYSLRTNLPRCLMGFPDYPFPPPPQKNGNGHVSDYPGHAQVLEFLKGYVRDFGLDKVIKLNTQVVRVEQVSFRGKLMWLVESKKSDVEDLSWELFEAVVVCNGHNTQPRTAQLPGIQTWPGKQIHSHNYRVPEPYRDQVVVLIGSGSSAYDICEQVSTVAKEVHLVSRWPGAIPSKVDMFQNVWLHSKVDYCYKNGEVAFDDGASVILADTILYCTGYKYTFPFLKTNGSVIVDNNRVGPLYKHIFPPQLPPTLSFVGIPTWAPVFVMVYLQAKWIAQVLSGKAILPTKEEMVADVEQHYLLMEQNGIPKHRTHSLSHSSTTFEYLDWLSSQVGIPPEVEMKEMYEICAEAVFFSRGFWSGFRDYIDARIPLSIRTSKKSSG